MHRLVIIMAVLATASILPATNADSRNTTISSGGVFPPESSTESPAPVDHEATDSTAKSSACPTSGAFTSAPPPALSSLPPPCLSKPHSFARTPGLRLRVALSDDCAAYSREASLLSEAFARCMGAAGLAGVTLAAASLCIVCLAPETIPGNIEFCRNTSIAVCTVIAGCYGSYQSNLAQIKARYTDRCIEQGGF